MVVESLGFADGSVLLGEVVVLPGTALESVADEPNEPFGSAVESEPVLGAAGTAWSPVDPVDGEPMLPEPVVDSVLVVESVFVVEEPDRSPGCEPMPVEVESDGGALSEGSFADEPVVVSVEGAPTASVSLARGEDSGVVPERWRIDEPVRPWPLRFSVFGFIAELSLSLMESSVVDCADFALSSEGSVVVEWVVVLVVSDALGWSAGSAAVLSVDGAGADGETAVVLLLVSCAFAPNAVNASVSAERAMSFKVDSSCLGSSRRMVTVHPVYNERGPARPEDERARCDYAEKLEPQPQVCLALGFLNEKPDCPNWPST